MCVSACVLAHSEKAKMLIHPSVNVKSLRNCFYEAAKGEKKTKKQRVYIYANHFLMMSNLHISLRY